MVRLQISFRCYLPVILLIIILFMHSFIVSFLTNEDDGVSENILNFAIQYITMLKVRCDQVLKHCTLFCTEHTLATLNL